MSDDWPYPREAGVETIQLAEINTMLWLIIGMMTGMFANVFYVLDDSVLAVACVVASAYFTFYGIGRFSSTWRPYIEKIPGISYDFPPIETVEAIDHPREEA